MTVNLNAEVVRVGLPVELGIRDAEEVERSDDLLGRDAHQADLGGVAAHFGGPETEKLLVGLDTLTVRGSRRPLKVHHTVNLDGGLVQESHAREFVYGDRLALGQSCDVCLIRGPLECGPGNLALDGLTLSVCGRAEVDVGE